MAKNIKKPYEGLTIMQQRCADALFAMKEPNKRKAYIQAGYKCRGDAADAAAAQVLGNIKVRAYLKKLRSRATEITLIDGVSVIKAFADVAKRAKEKDSMSNEIKALENLGKHFGIYEKDNRQGSEELMKMLEVWLRQIDGSGIRSPIEQIRGTGRRSVLETESPISCN